MKKPPIRTGPYQGLFRSDILYYTKEIKLSIVALGHGTFDSMKHEKHVAKGIS